MVYVKAIYKDGHLQLLEPVEFPENSVLKLNIEVLPEDNERYEIIQLAKMGGRLADADELELPDELLSEDDDEPLLLPRLSRSIADLIDEERGLH